MYAGSAGPIGAGGSQTIMPTAIGDLATAIGDRQPMPTVGDIGAGGNRFQTESQDGRAGARPQQIVEAVSMEA